MSPQSELQTKLGALATRMRVFVLETRIAWCLLPGLVVALGVLAAHKLDRLDQPVVPMAIAVAVGLAAGLTWGFLRPIRLLDAAMLADRALGLKERLSNAVVFAEMPDASPLVPALVADAGRHASDIVPSTVLPHRPPKPLLWAGGVTLAIAALWFLPQYPLGRTEGEVAVRREMREQGEELKEIAERVKEEAKTEGEGVPAQLAEKLEELARELEKAKLSKKEALLKTGQLASEVREAQKRAALAAGAGAMAKASEALESSTLETPSGQAMAKAIHERKAADLASELSKLSESLKEDVPESAEERKQMASDLRKMSEALAQAGMGDAAASAAAAAEALEQGDGEGASESLRDAAEAASDAAQQAAANDSLQEMAEALEESQTDVAQADQSTCPDCGQPSHGGG